MVMSVDPVHVKLLNPYLRLMLQAISVEYESEIWKTSLGDVVNRPLSNIGNCYTNSKAVKWDPI